MSSPIRRIQKPKQVRVPRRGIAERLVAGMSSNISPAPATPSIATDTPSIVASIDPVEYMDIDADSIFETMNVSSEEELRLREEDHDRYLDGEISDPDSSDDGEVEDIGDIYGSLTEDSPEIEEPFEGMY